eukprot:48992_1
MNILVFVVHIILNIHHHHHHHQLKRKKEDKQEEEKDNDNEEEKKQMDIDDGTGNKDENKDNNNNKKDDVIDPARQTAIDQLLSIVPDDRELVVFALDTLQNNAPNNVSVALEWIFTHQEAWKKKKEDEAQLEKDATINDDDE